MIAANVVTLLVAFWLVRQGENPAIAAAPGGRRIAGRGTGRNAMMLDSILFYFFATLAVVSAILMVTRRNAVHSAVFLITSLLATAGIFLQLQAEFLFIVQIILYVGGIMVLFVFVIMLVNLDVAVRQMKFNRNVGRWPAGARARRAGRYWFTACGGGSVQLAGGAGDDACSRTPSRSARSLFQKYMLPFEIASILLLVAMIGAVVMAKRKI